MSHKFKSNTRYAATYIKHVAEYWGDEDCSYTVSICRDNLTLVEVAILQQVIDDSAGVLEHFCVATGTEWVILNELITDELRKYVKSVRAIQFKYKESMVSMVDIVRLYRNKTPNQFQDVKSGEIYTYEQIIEKYL
jgi:hypothetical protein